MNRRLLLATAAATASVALGAAPAGSAPVAAPSCGYSASYHAPNHHPHADRNWVVRVNVRPSTLSTAMKYQFLFSGRIVATRYVDGKRNFHFRGHMSDAVVWPKRAIGIPLVFRIVLHNRCATKHWDYKVLVQR